MPPLRPDGSPWPRISIVTPSYNQAKFVEQTLRSVLLQGYPDLEYIVMDGGSTDGAAEVIEKYRLFLAHVKIGSDGGQAAAINAGFAEATGSIFAWINSDDGYFPGALRKVATAMRPRGIVIGNHLAFADSIAAYYQTTPFPRRFYWQPGQIPQHSTFWAGAIHRPVDTQLWGAFDYELWFQLFPLADHVDRINTALAYVYIHPAQKTHDFGSGRWADDTRRILTRYGDFSRAQIEGKSTSRVIALTSYIHSWIAPPPDLATVKELVEGRSVQFMSQAEHIKQAVRRRLPGATRSS